MPATPSDQRPSLGSNNLQALAVTLIALAASVPGLPNVFTYDDVALIQDNARLHTLLNWWSVLTSPYWPAPWSQELYRPVMSLLLSLEYAVGHGSPLVFRVVSDVLYVGASVLVLLLARRLLPAMAALAVAALFAAHPVHVEAVAPAVNQGELLVASLAIASLVLFLDRRRADAVRPGTWLALTLMTAVAALTKENGFVIPALLLCADLTFDQTLPSPGRVRTRWRGYALLAVTCALLLWIRSRVLSGDFVGTYTAEALVGATFGERLLTTLQVVPQWFRLLLWPAHLQMDYSPDEMVASTHLGLAEATGLVLLVATAMTAFAMRRRAPVVTFGLLSTGIALLPVSNVLVTSSILLAERTLFLPSAFFLMAVVGAVLALWPSVAERQRAFASAAMLFVPLLVLVGAYRSGARQTVWRNPVRLWHAAALEAPKSKRVQQARRDATAALLADYAPVIAASKEPWNTRREVASLLHAMGDDSAAVEQFKLVVAEHPDHRAATLDLATLYMSFGRFIDARHLASEEIARGDSTEAWRRVLQRADSAMRSR